MRFDYYADMKKIILKIFLLYFNKNSVIPFTVINTDNNYRIL